MSELPYSLAMQGPLLLDVSRSQRFRDDRKDLLLHLLGICPGMVVADLGCGPGALARKLATWLGASSRVIGLERAPGFLRYARWKAQTAGLSNLQLIQGDVLRAPIDSRSVDACTSYTVIEHVPNAQFLLEQKRICRRGGPVSVMMAQPKSYIRSCPEARPQISEREKELRRPLDEVQAELDAQAKPGRYWPEPGALPRLFGALGFTGIQVDALAAPVGPDDARNTAAQKSAWLEAAESVDLEYVDRILSIAPTALADHSAEELRGLIRARHAQRRRLLDEGLAVWDYEIVIILIVRGSA